MIMVSLIARMLIGMKTLKVLVRAGYLLVDIMTMRIISLKLVSMVMAM